MTALSRNQRLLISLLRLVRVNRMHRLKLRPKRLKDSPNSRLTKVPNSLIYLRLRVLQFQPVLLFRKLILRFNVQVNFIALPRL
jgi:hypothetical protein